MMKGRPAHARSDFKSGFTTPISNFQKPRQQKEYGRCYPLFRFYCFYAYNLSSSEMKSNSEPNGSLCRTHLLHYILPVIFSANVDGLTCKLNDERLLSANIGKFIGIGRPTHLIHLFFRNNFSKWKTVLYPIGRD